MQVPKVYQMRHPRSGNPVANQFIIETPDGDYFQSYRTIIAFKPRDMGSKIQLDRDSWDYSRTTSRYRNEFLGETTKETREKIKAGDLYELTDLN